MSPRNSSLHVGLRQLIARLERRQAARPADHISFGIGEIDRVLPGGGLPRGALHEICGAGPDCAHATASALLAAGLLARCRGSVVWAMQRRDIFAPALAAVGLHPDRVIYAEAGKPETVLLVMEEALRHRGLAGVVGELSGRLGLTASRRLQLSAETTSAVAFALRRSQRHDDPCLHEPSAAVTRWRVMALPQASPWTDENERVPGLDRPRWRLELLRCRGGEPASWIVEGCDATGHLALATDLVDRSAAPATARKIRRAIA